MESMHLVDLIEKRKSENASDQRIKKDYDQYIEIIAREKKIPQHGTLELTPYCNLDCKMCYVHLNCDQFSKDRLIPVETWKKLIDDAHDAGMLYASLTGGECLTYPEFDELYHYLYSKGIVPCILSNGLLIDEKRLDFFKRYPPSHIQVTLYGSSDDAYEAVTGHRAFHTIYRNLEMLRDSHLRVSLTLTPSSFMWNDIRPLQQTAESLRLPYGINVKLVTPRDETGRVLKDLEPEQYIEIYKINKEIKQESLIPIDPIELPMPNTKGNSVYGLQCGGGSSSFTIKYNGKMSPCPSLSDITTDPLQDGFLNAWHQLNELVSHYPMPMECPGCIYRDYCLMCPAIHNNARNPGHCDPNLCKRTKMMIQEGFFQLSDRMKERLNDA